MNKNLITAITLVLGGIIAVLNSTILTPILPVIMDEMDISATTVQWIVSLFMLVNAVVVPMTAYVMGRFNVRQLFGAAMAFLAVGSVFCMWAPSFGWLLAGRALQAVASGILMPVIVTVLMLLYPPEKRGTVMGAYMLSISAAPAVGPVLIGALADTLGWRPVFVFVAVLSVILLFVGNALIGKTTAGKPATLDFPSVVLSVVPLLCLLYGFSSLSTAHPLLVGVLIAVGVIGLALFARRQLKMSVPYLDVRVLSYRNYAFGTLLSAVANVVLTLLTVTLPLFLQNVCGASATVSGLAIAPVAAGAAIASMVAGKLYDSLGPRVTSVGGAVLATLAAAGLLLGNADTPVLLSSVLAALVGIGAMATNVPMNTWAVNALPNESISHGNALGSTLRQVASSLCTALSVAIMSLASSMATSSGAATGEAALAGTGASFIFLFALAACTLVVALVFVKK